MLQRMTRSIGGKILATAGVVTVAVFLAMLLVTFRWQRQAAEDVITAVAAIARRTDRVSQATGETAVHIAEVSRTSGDHAALAEDLRRLVAAFQL